MKNLKETKILGIVGNILMLVSLFLPYFTASTIIGSASTSLMADSGFGFFFLVLIVINLFLVFGDKIFTKSKFFGSAGKQKLTLIPTAILLFFQIIIGVVTDEYSVKNNSWFYWTWLWILGIMDWFNCIYCLPILI